MGNELIDYLACPKCHSSLLERKGQVKCSKSSCGVSYKKDGEVYDFLDFDALDEDLQLSIGKWDEFYAQELGKKSYKDLYKTYLKNNFDPVSKQLNSEKALNKDLVFLEIGSGPLFLGQALAEKCKLVIGIDFSLEALKMAEQMCIENGIDNYLLILGDIRNMPLREGVVDLVYGGGVIEHFKDTFGAVKEFYRVLSVGGVAFNTVPLLNIGSLTYRQVWGNIPEFPIIKQLAEFAHIKLLKAKHMTFGYELSFLRSHMRYLHRKAGFSGVKITKFETTLLFEFIPFKWMKDILMWLANNSSLFWPMIKVIGVK